MRVVIGISGASGAIYGVEFVKRCPAEEKFVILSRWGRSLLQSEAGLSPNDLAPFAKKVYSTDDLSSPFASYLSVCVCVCVCLCVSMSLCVCVSVCVCL